MSNYVEQAKSEPHPVAEDDPLAIALLKEEHLVFRQLFDRANATEGEELAAVASELLMRLGVHLTIEEEILYPALKGAVEADEVNEGIVEHQSAKVLIAELEQLSGKEELFKAKVHVLGEETIHHINEEDSDMFEDAKKAHQAGKIDLDAVGEQLAARRQELYDNIVETGEEGVTCEANANEVESVIPEIG